VAKSPCLQEVCGSAQTPEPNTTIIKLHQTSSRKNYMISFPGTTYEHQPAMWSESVEVENLTSQSLMQKASTAANPTYNQIMPSELRHKYHPIMQSNLLQFDQISRNKWQLFSGL
jgi:hypothetical protein